tara:strand:+ start:89 stop:367 length:279 start_codon:yes stop_codon:yes gene_type:complete
MESTLTFSSARSNILTRLAALMELSPQLAIFVPACIEGAARKVGWLESQFAQEMFRNTELRDYVAQTIRKIADSAEGREMIRDYTRKVEVAQ